MYRISRSPTILGHKRWQIIYFADGTIFIALSRSSGMWLIETDGHIEHPQFKVGVTTSHVKFINFSFDVYWVVIKSIDMS